MACLLTTILCLKNILKCLLKWMVITWIFKSDYMLFGFPQKKLEILSFFKTVKRFMRWNKLSWYHCNTQGLYNNAVYQHCCVSTFHQQYIRGKNLNIFMYITWLFLLNKTSILVNKCTVDSKEEWVCFFHVSKSPFINVPVIFRCNNYHVLFIYIQNSNASLTQKSLKLDTKRDTTFFFHLFSQEKKKNNKPAKRTRKTEPTEAVIRHRRLLSVSRVLLVYSLWTPPGVARDFWELLEECQGTCFTRKKQPWGLWLPAVCNEAVHNQRVLWARRDK